MKLSYVLAAALAFAMIPGRVFAADDMSTQDQTSTYSSDYSRKDEVKVKDETGAVTSPTTDTRDVKIVNDIDVDRTSDREMSKKHSDAKGITVGALGGVEGYTGSLAPRIAPGGAWGLLVGLQPSKFVGAELAYQGAANHIDDSTGFGPGGTLLRNGGNVNLKISLAPTRLEPFIFGGIGMSRYDVNGAGNDVAFNSAQDWVGQVPAGGGLNLHLGRFTAGARMSYNVLFGRDIGPVTETNSAGIDNKHSGDFWNGTLQLGSTFF